MRHIAMVLIISVVTISTSLCDGLGAGLDAAGQPAFMGMMVKLGSGWLTIARILEDYAASRKDLAAGDRILKIDEKGTGNKAFEDCLKQLAGAPGKKVTLTVVPRASDQAQPFEATPVWEMMKLDGQAAVRDHQGAKPDSVLPPTKYAGPVQWKGNKIVSRVLPYPDFVSLFIRLPIAHAMATGKGVKVTVLQLSEDKTVSSVIQKIAPDAEVTTYTWGINDVNDGRLIEKLSNALCRIAVVHDLPMWPEATLVQLAQQLAAQKVMLIVPSDLSEDEGKIDAVNRVQAIGALTVGRVDRQLRVMTENREGLKPFNQHIREIHTDVFSTIGGRFSPYDRFVNPVTTAAGVAALVLEKWPNLSPAEVREKIIGGARPVWQATSIQSGQWQRVFSVDPITTQYVPKDEQAIFRFRVLDAPGALGVDTEIPWFLNMLNCQKAWEITKGQGTLVVVSDQGFHIKHPALVEHIQATKHFGQVSFDPSDQNFHGTDMSRILLAVAPDARIIPVLCSGTSREELADNIAQSFHYAAEQKADVATASWAEFFNTNERLLAAIRRAVDSGTVVSWFHYPESYPGVLRSRFAYAQWGESPLGFSDRFLTDPPGFHPVEIEAGLSGTAPQAAGIAALVKSVNPKLTPKQIEDLIIQNSSPIGGGILIPDVYQIVVAAKKTDTNHEQSTHRKP